MNPGAYIHPTRDPLLSVLGALRMPVGSLVRAFPGIGPLGAHQDWLDSWFREQLGQTTEPPREEDSGSEELSAQLKAQLETPEQQANSHVRLLSLRPHYFRGFRESRASINLDAALVVFEGRNSSGKTSLAESLEWLFTGQLQRRLDQEQGNPQELAECVQSQLRPPAAETYVEAVLELGDGTSVRLKRVLVADYGETATSRCESSVFLDDKPLSAGEEREFFDAQFAGVAPLLMQHTLREFVHSSPTKRRAYFERLLNMNQITALIERAVVGDARLREFPSPSGSSQLQRWTDTATRAQDQRIRRLFRAATSAPDRAKVEEVLLAVARDTMPALVPVDAGYEQAADALQLEQKRVREAQFPLLSKLVPTRALDQNARDFLGDTMLSEAVNELERNVALTAAAREALSVVTVADRRLALPLAALVSGGLLSAESDSQPCPLCESTDSLKRPRLEHLLAVEPLSRALEAATEQQDKSLNRLIRAVKGRTELMQALVPLPPTDLEWDNALAKAPLQIAERARTTRSQLAEIELAMRPVRSAVTTVGEVLARGAPDVALIDSAIRPGVQQISAGGQLAIDQTLRIGDAVKTLESQVAASASDSTAYSARATWLELAGNRDLVVSELEWEVSKRRAQAQLNSARSVLMLVRQVVLESRRKAFSDRMGEIWRLLRQDTFSHFKDLHIPAPSGRGFPVSIQVRATLDDSVRQVDVDALRVFSESQVNVLGIGAFVTRSAMLGHSVIVLDDPVQSMDEEHFKTFAAGLLADLLARGLQVILLTHNESFAKDVSWAHSELSDYATLTMRHSRRDGCLIEEGTRRVPERLKRAEQLAEAGELPAAWRLIRLALERLYTLVKCRLEPQFDADSWRSASAEDMWNQGVGEAIEGAVPGSRKELKRILDETAAAAHDKPSRGETDVKNGVKYIRSLLGPLRVGG